MTDEQKTVLNDAIGELPFYTRWLARWAARAATAQNVQTIFNIRCATGLRNRRVRFAFAVILKLPYEDKYFLVRVASSRHPDSYAPFGGVVHHNEPEILNRTAAAPDPEATTFADGSRCDTADLRRVVDGKHIPALYRWYIAPSKEREDPVIALKRELDEELKSIGLNLVCSQIGDLAFREVRRVSELVHVSGLSYQYQYRHFTVLEGSPDVNTTKCFAQNLSVHAATNENLLLATHEEIMRGRSRDGMRIGAHSAYLFGLRRGRNDY